MKKIKLGIVGYGSFCRTYMDCWLDHPLVEKVVVAEVLESRRKEVAERFHVETYSSYEEMLEKADIDCVGVFTQRHQHGPMVIKALNMGKHVFSAVPMGIEEEEIFEILRLVKEKRLIYMMNETCYYFPCSVWCRNAYKEGKFGKFVYGEAQYYHDIEDMMGSFASQGDKAKRVAGIPPMFYSTHSMAMLFSAIDDYPVEVTCFGIRDKVGDGIYGEGLNDWDNPYSNEVAILRMSKGGIARINEFRRVGTVKPSSYITGVYGEEGAYEGSGMQHLFSRNVAKDKEFSSENVSDEINTFFYTEAQKTGKLEENAGRVDYFYHCGFSPVQNYERLPEKLKNIYELHDHDYDILGHNGSHPLLVDDFVRAVITGKLPPVDPWMAASYTLGGIYAHKSAMLGGVTLKLPDIGTAPSDWAHIDYADIVY